MNELEKISTFRADLAIAETIEEIKLHETAAMAMAEFARANKISLEKQNELGRFRIEIEQKKGGWLDENFPSNVGTGSNQYAQVTSNDLSKMPVPKQESAKARKIAHAEPDVIAEIEDRIESKGEVITPNKIVTALKSIEQQEKHDAILNNEVPNTVGKYDVIVIDPPWIVKKIEREVAPNQSKELDYPTMTIDQIASIEMPFKENAHLFMWTTQKFLPDAISIVERWGAKYVLAMVWHKPGGFQPYNLPQYNNEFCIYARVGAPKFIDTKAFNTCNSWPRGAHSEKPQEFYDLINRVCGGDKIDMFNRREIKGFNTWGNESV